MTCQISYWTDPESPDEMIAKDRCKTIMNIDERWLPEFVPNEDELKNLETVIGAIQGKVTTHFNSSPHWRFESEEALLRVQDLTWRGEVAEAIGVKSDANSVKAIHQAMVESKALRMNHHGPPSICSCTTSKRKITTRGCRPISSSMQPTFSKQSGIGSGGKNQATKLDYTSEN